MQASEIIIWTIIIAILIPSLLALFIFYIPSLYHQKQTSLQANFKAELAKVEMEVQEQTFIDISQELHDSLGEQLRLAREYIKKTSALLCEKERVNNEEAITLINNSLSGIKNFSRGLLPGYLAINGLTGVLRKSIASMSKLQNCIIDFAVTGEEQLIEGKKGMFLLRMLQEAITNSSKHAQAQLISVSLDFGNELLTATVKDDGIGFSIEEKLKSGYRSGLGLQNIIRRAKMINVTCIMESNTNNHKGTIICITTTYH